MSHEELGGGVSTEGGLDSDGAAGGYTFSKRRMKAEALRNTVVEPLEEGGVELAEGDAVI